MHALMPTSGALHARIDAYLPVCVCPCPSVYMYIYIYIYVQASVDLVLCHVQARNSKQSTGEPRKRLANKC